MEQRIRDKVDEYDHYLQRQMKEAISSKVNKLGEEIAVDVNNMENKIKLINSEHSSFQDIIK